MLTPLESENRLTKYSFRQHLEREFLRPRTIELYYSLFGPMDNYFQSIQIPTPDDIRGFVKLHPRGYYFSALFYFCLAKYGVSIMKPRGKGYKEPPRKKRTRPEFSSLAEAFEMIKPQLGSQERLAIELRLYSGRRIAEILMIKTSNIDFETNEIHFPDMKGGEYGLTPMNETIRERLRSYIRDKDLLGGDYLFYKQNLNPKTRGPARSKYNQFKRALINLKSEQALVFLKTHDIRSAVISKIIQEKGILQARAWVDHKQLETTNKYANAALEKSQKKDAMEVMSK